MRLLLAILLSVGSAGWAIAAPGQLVARLHSIQMTISAGSAGPGHGYVYFIVSGERITPRLSTLDGIQVVAPTEGVERLTNGHDHWQMITQECFVDLVTISPFKYEMRFYPLSAVGPMSGGYHTVKPGAKPNQVSSFENPDGAARCDRYRAVVTKDGKSDETLYTFSDADGAEHWTCTTENGAKTTILVKAWNKEQTVRTDRRSYYEGSKFIADVLTTTTEFPWGEEKTEEITDPGTAWAKKSTWSYYDKPTDHGYQRPKLWVDGSGYWERYEYDADSFLIKTVRQTDGAPLGTAGDKSEEEIVEHPNPDTNLKIRRQFGREVERTYYADEGTFLFREETSTTGAPLGDPSNEITIKVFADRARGPIVGVWYPEIQENEMDQIAFQCDSIVAGKFSDLGHAWSDAFGAAYHEGAVFDVQENLRGSLTGKQKIRFIVRPRPTGPKVTAPEPGRDYLLFVRSDAEGGPQVLKYLEATPERREELQAALHGNISSADPSQALQEEMLRWELGGLLLRIACGDPFNTFTDALSGERHP